MLVAVVMLVVMVMSGVVAASMRMGHGFRIAGEPCCSISVIARRTQLQLDGRAGDRSRPGRRFGRS
jgi:hypothetical protein